MARQKQEEAKKGAPEWMNTYGDLVTLLLCFFILLFSFSSIDVAKFKALVNSFENNIDLLTGGQAVEEGDMVNNGISQLDELATYYINEKSKDTNEQETEKDNDNEEKTNTENEKIAKDIKEYVEKKNIANKIDVTYTAQYVLLSLNGATLFDSGKADLRADSIQLLNSISEVLKKYTKNTIAIEGHTDNRPINTSQFPSNMYLSSARAIKVYEYLVGNKKFDAKKLFAVGYGEYRPVASNENEAGRSKNRRVEIKIINSIE